MEKWCRTMIVICLMLSSPGAIAAIQELTRGGSDGSPWPCFRRDSSHTGLSPYDTQQNNGKLVMKYPSGGEVHSSPAVGDAGDGSVYFGSMDGSLYAYEVDGVLMWSYRTGGGIYSSPAISSDGSLIFGSMDGFLYCLYPNGSLCWRFRTEGGIRSSPIIGDDGTVLFGSKDGFLYALDGSGKEIWNFRTEGEVDSSPAIGPDGTIYFGSDDGNVYALTSDGDTKWTYPTESWVFSSPAVDGSGNVYIGSDDDRLVCLDPEGDPLWRYDAGDDVYSSPAISLDGTIYIGSDNDTLIALDTEGREIWNYSVKGDMVSSPAVDSNGIVFVGSRDGHLYCIDPSGDLRWAFQTGGAISSSPSIGPNGDVYVGSLDGSIYAIGVDRYPPTLHKDRSDQTATTGDAYTFRIDVRDDRYSRATAVFVEYWFGAGGHFNRTMEGDSESRSYTLSMDTGFVGSMYYRFHASDMCSQWSAYPGPFDMNYTKVTDNDVPTFLDLTEGTPTTGDPYVFKMDADDNAGVRSVLVDWSLGNGNDVEECSKDSDGHYAGSIDVPDILGDLAYTISVRDTAGLIVRSTPRLIHVVDDDLPEVRDHSPDNASLGSIYHFNASITDNIEVVSAILEFRFDGGAIERIELSSANDTYESGISVPDALIEELAYSVNATDSSRNEFRTDQRKVRLMDRGPPEISDLTSGLATTGERFRILARVSDTCNISHVRIEAGFAMGEMEDLPVQSNDCVHIAEMDVPSNSVDTLWYRIIAVDGSGNERASQIKEVIVRDNDPPEIVELIGPTNGTTGDDVSIQASTIDNIGIHRITLTYWSEDLGPFSLVGSNSVCSFEIIIPWDSNESIECRIEVLDVSGNTAMSEFAIAVRDDDPPTVTIENVSGEPKEGSELLVRVNATDNIGVRRVLLRYSIGGGAERSIELNEESDLWYCRVPLDSSGEFRCTVDAYDHEGNGGPSDEWSMEISPVEERDGFPIGLFTAVLVVSILMVVVLAVWTSARMKRSKKGTWNGDVRANEGE